MKGFLEQMASYLAPFELSVWAIPTAIAAFVIHGLRLLAARPRLARKTGAAPWRRSA